MYMRGGSLSLKKEQGTTMRPMEAGVKEGYMNGCVTDFKAFRLFAITYSVDHTFTCIHVVLFRITDFKIYLKPVVFFFS